MQTAFAVVPRLRGAPSRRREEIHAGLRMHRPRHADRRLFTRGERARQRDAHGARLSVDLELRGRSRRRGAGHVQPGGVQRDFGQTRAHRRKRDRGVARDLFPREVELQVGAVSLDVDLAVADRMLSSFREAVTGDDLCGGGRTGKSQENENAAHRSSEMVGGFYCCVFRT